MNTRKRKFVVASVLVIGLAIATIPRDVAASPVSTIYSFGTTQPIDGGVPKGSLTYVNGLLFGRTTTTTLNTPTPGGTPIGSYGVIFHFGPNNVASSYSIDHMFAGHDADDGDNPRHDAMTPLNGLLYGTTLEGGTHNNGIIFSIGQDGTGYQVLLSLHNSIGDESHSCFVVANNILYGMTASGGDNGEGVVFSFDPSAPTPTPTATPTPTPANFQTLFSFACASSTGKEPHGRLTLDPNGTTLYGMTRQGGEHDYGVVFKIDTSGNNYTELHDFAGGDSDGATSDHGYVVQSGDNPYGSLLLVGDQLYGTTANGGDNDLGTVFVINMSGNNYQRLYSFGGKTNNGDGSKPIDNVILVNGWLYGMTTEGGANNQGTIFQVSPTPARSPTPAPRPTPPPP